MMNVQILTYNFPPQRSAGANRLSGLARTFRESGATTRVVAARFEDDGPLPADQKDLVTFTEWVSCDAVRRSSFFVRFLDEWRIAKGVFSRIDSSAADFVVVTSPVLSFLLRAPFVIPRHKLVIDLRDLTWEYRISSSPMVRLMQGLLAMWARWSLAHAKLVACSTKAEQRYVNQKVPSVEAIHVANGIEERVFTAMAGERRTGVRSTGRQSLLYAGSMGKAQGVGIFADAARAMPDFDFVAIGEGIEAQALNEAKKIDDLSNLIVLGSLPRAQVLEHYRQADVLFVRLRPGFASAVPSKVYEYLAASKPIIYMGAEGDAAWEVLDGFAGTTRVADEDLAGLVNACQRATPLSAEAVKENGLKLKAYTREAQANRLVARLEELLSGSCTRLPVTQA